jgi:hypothetical protein
MLSSRSAWLHNKTVSKKKKKTIIEFSVTFSQFHSAAYTLAMKLQDL